MTNPRAEADYCSFCANDIHACTVMASLVVAPEEDMLGGWPDDVSAGSLQDQPALVSWSAGSRGSAMYFTCTDEVLSIQQAKELSSSHLRSEDVLL